MIKEQPRGYEQNRKRYPHGLSRRTYEMMQLLFKYDGNRQRVADAMIIADCTLRTHLNAAFRVLGAHSVAEALCKFVKLESKRLKEERCQLQDSTP